LIEQCRAVTAARLRFGRNMNCCGWGRAVSFLRHDQGQVRGKQVWDDPLLHKNATSELAVLSDETSAAGVARIEAALASAIAAGKELVFPVDLSFAMVTGWVARRGNIKTV